MSSRSRSSTAKVGGTWVDAELAGAPGHRFRAFSAGWRKRGRAGGKPVLNANPLDKVRAFGQNAGKWRKGRDLHA